jgi:hypothetical protein
MSVIIDIVGLGSLRQLNLRQKKFLYNFKFMDYQSVDCLPPRHRL